MSIIRAKQIMSEHPAHARRDHEAGYRNGSAFINGKFVSIEAPGANIFFIKSGTLCTPDSGCLEGITRKTAIDLAADLGIPVRTARFHVDQLVGADEAFITSTGGGIIPVNSVEGRVLGGVVGPGELTTQLHNLYWTKRWDGWLGTPVNYDEPISNQLSAVTRG